MFLDLAPNSTFTSPFHRPWASVIASSTSSQSLSIMSNGYNPYTNAPALSKKTSPTSEPLLGFLPRNVNAAQVTKAMVSAYQALTVRWLLIPTL